MNAGRTDVTIDTPLSSDSLAGEPQEDRVRGPRIQFVGVASETPSGEPTELLRRRLMIAALVLAMAVGSFMLWRLLATALGVEATEGAPGLFGQSFVLAAELLCALWLWKTRPAPPWTLQLSELLIFGTPALFMIMTQLTMMRLCARHDNMLPHVEIPWMLLIFTYAMFIPNTWRRAAIAIGAFALAPLALTGSLWLTDQLCAELLNKDLWFVIMAVTAMMVSGVSAVIGVHTINSLRQEAFEARQLGQYRLKKRLGGGGMGEVYLAEHLLMKRPCAIKLIRPDRAGDRRTLVRFEREVQATAKLSHWNTIDIYDYGRAADGTFYYVMEYLPGMSLDDLVRQHGPLPAGRVIFLLAQTCDALAEAHANGLIHRDIKPANVFVALRGGRHDVAKLLDFGMVKPVARFESASITQVGSITGSPLFMSPEQALGEAEPDQRSDIYSLGVVAYFLLTGRPPFEDRQPIQVLFAHANRPPERPGEIGSGVPADLEAVVLRCLAKTPDDRFQTAFELQAALQACDAAGDWSFEEAAAWWHEVGPADPMQLDEDPLAGVEQRAAAAREEYAG